MSKPKQYSQKNTQQKVNLFFFIDCWHCSYNPFLPGVQMLGWSFIHSFAFSCLWGFWPPTSVYLLGHIFLHSCVPTMTYASEWEAHQMGTKTTKCSWHSHFIPSECTVYLIKYSLNRWDFSSLILENSGHFPRHQWEQHWISLGSPPVPHQLGKHFPRKLLHERECILLSITSFWRNKHSWLNLTCFKRGGGSGFW